REQAEKLVMNAEGRLCVRFYRRIDGTIITENCPVGWGHVKRRARVISTAIMSLIAGLFSGLLFVSMFAREGQKADVGILALPVATPTPRMEPTTGMIANSNR